MMQERHIILFIVLLGVFSGAALAAYTQELWNDPAKTNNNWSYYDTDAPQPYDVDMTWSATGGVDNTGYVKCSLYDLESVHHNGAYWPAYLYRGLGDDQEIDLSIPNASVNIYAKNASSPMGGMNLQGGSLRFFIGEWFEGTDPGPEDDTWAFFYNTTPVTINDHSWAAESTIPIGSNSNWGVISRTNSGISPDDLFYQPQQWGFVIFNAASEPTGILALDSFRIVPEPATLLILGLGGMLIRKKK